MSFALIAISHSLRSWHLSCPMSNEPGTSRAHACTACSDGVVPCIVPPLPLSETCPKCPRFLSNPQHRISFNPLRPHVPASDRFTSWLTPYGIARMNAEVSRFPPDIIIRRRLVMARSILPNMLKNYASGLTRFTKFCDDFHIPESERMPASDFLLSTFITTHGAGSVGKGALKTWVLGLELWHRINSAPWFGGAELQRAIEGSAKLAPSSSCLAKRDPVTIGHLRALHRCLDLTNSFDIAVFAVACIAFWCCCRCVSFLHAYLVSFCSSGLTWVQVMRVAN